MTAKQRPGLSHSLLSMENPKTPREGTRKSEQAWITPLVLMLYTYCPAMGQGSLGLKDREQGRGFSQACSHWHSLTWVRAVTLFPMSGRMGGSSPTWKSK